MATKEQREAARHKYRQFLAGKGWPTSLDVQAHWELSEEESGAGGGSKEALRGEAVPGKEDKEVEDHHIVRRIPSQFRYRPPHYSKNVITTKEEKATSHYNYISVRIWSQRPSNILSKT